MSLCSWHRPRLVSCFSHKQATETRDYPTSVSRFVWIPPKLLLLLADNAYLASLVRSIDLRDSSIDPEHAPVREAAQKAGRRGALTPAYQQVLNAASDQALQSAAGVFLVALLPNVTSLTYDMSAIYGVSESLWRDTKKALFDRVDASRDIRQKLRELRIAQTLVDFPPNSIFSCSAFLHEAVEKLYGFDIILCLGGDSLGHRDPRLLAPLPDRLGLRLVEFEDACITVRGLRAFLKLCPILQTLRITLGSRAARLPYKYLDFAGMGQAIREYGLRLEELSIDFRNLDLFRHSLKGSCRTVGCIGSLRELMWLRKLGVPYGALFGGCFDIDDHEESSDSEILGNFDLDDGLGGEEDKHFISDSASSPNNTAEAQTPSTLDQCLPDCLERLRFFPTFRTEDVGDLNKQICDLIRSPARQGTLYRIQLHKKEGFLDDTEAFGFKKSHASHGLCLTREM